MLIDAPAGAPVRPAGRHWRRMLVLLCCCLGWRCALQPVPRDLALYVNRDVHGIAELETLALQRYSSLSGGNYVSDAVLKAGLEAQVVPVYARFVALAGQIKPRTEPVRRLHTLLLEAGSSRLQGFRTVLLALDTQDAALIGQANRMLAQGQSLSAQWREQVGALARQYGLELK